MIFQASRKRCQDDVACVMTIRHGVVVSRLKNHPDTFFSHTAGVINSHPNPTARLDRDAVLAWFMRTPLEHQPGTKWSYSNVGYAVLAAIIERVENAPFPEVVRNRVFRAAGMDDTYFLDDASLDRDRLARGSGPESKKYGLDGDPLNYGQTWLRMGAGGIVATARDLLRWEMALRSGKVLSAAQYAIATTPAGPSDGYGLR